MSWRLDGAGMSHLVLVTGDRPRDAGSGMSHLVLVPRRPDVEGRSMSQRVLVVAGRIAAEAGRPFAGLSRPVAAASGRAQRSSIAVWRSTA